EPQEVGIVLLAVNEDAVTSGRLLIDAVEGIEIGRRAGLAHLHTLAPREANVVAPLLLHAGQDRLFVGAHIEHPGASRVGGIGIAPESESRERPEPALVAMLD